MMEILECQQLMDNKQAAFTRYSDVSGERGVKPSFLSFNIESHIRLVQFIKSGDFAQAKGLIISTV
ncbi:MAG TPA: hypothetical protein PKE04_22435, partial [Clostridia bacterium]|nr:hypothetical protein [Clostridia bacterium]